MEECLKILNSWIIKVKNTKYKQYTQVEKASSLDEYKNSLEELESKLRSEILKEDNISELQRLGFPEELMECITNMQIKPYILDRIQQAFTVNHFNQSPLHEAELNEKKLL